MSEGAPTLADVIEGLTGVRPDGLEQHLISKTVMDSRKVGPGALFVALKGEREDGHDYVGDALARGAAAAIIEREVEVGPQVVRMADAQPAAIDVSCLPLLLKTDNSLEALQRLAAFWRRQHNVRVIGITGSVGKTTTKELTASVLSRRYVTLRSEASYNNETGLPLTLLRLTGQHERAVLEMGMYDVGEIANLARIAQPHVGVVTIVGPVHLERAKTLERITAAKRELIEALPPAPVGTAILNYDDERVRAMAQATEARVFYYGITPQANLWADEIEGLGLDGVRFRLHYRGEVLHVKVPLLGRHSVHTALRATAVGLIEGMHWQEIVEGLRSLSAQVRLVAVPGPTGSTILDDTYNASPASTMAALKLLEELEGRRIVVLGDMLELGEYEQEGHERVGFRVIEVADVLITVGHRGQIIGQTAVRWGMPQSDVHTLGNNADAIALLERIVDGDDVILVKGSREMRMEEIVDALGRS